MRREKYLQYSSAGNRQTANDEHGAKAIMSEKIRIIAIAPSTPLAVCLLPANEFGASNTLASPSVIHTCPDCANWYRCQNQEEGEKMCTEMITVACQNVTVGSESDDFCEEFFFFTTALDDERLRLKRQNHHLYGSFYDKVSG